MFESTRYRHASSMLCHMDYDVTLAYRTSVDQVAHPYILSGSSTSNLAQMTFGTSQIVAMITKAIAVTPEEKDVKLQDRNAVVKSWSSQIKCELQWTIKSRIVHDMWVHMCTFV